MADVELLPPGDLRVARQPDRRRKLTQELRLRIHGEIFTVPRGSVTDYSSVPWFARGLVRWDRVDLAGVAHDMAYKSGTHGLGGRPLSRREADRIWRIVAQAGQHHANFAQAWICWAGLRLGGWIVWRRYRRKD